MTSAPTDVHGPVDFVLLELPREGLTGETGSALIDLVERGTIRLYDLMVISKDASGAVEVLELTDPVSGAGTFTYFAGAARACSATRTCERLPEPWSPTPSPR